MSGVVDVEEVVVACVFEVAEEGCYGAAFFWRVSAWLVGLRREKEMEGGGKGWVDCTSSRRIFDLEIRKNILFRSSCCT